MTDPALVARVRAEVAAGIDPAALLAVYAEPARRALLRERVRVAARVPVADAELDAMCAELFGFGPLQPLLDDPEVTDVLVNGPRDIFCERSGRLERVDVAFRGAEDVAELAHRIAGSVGRELTLERPFVDARMRDGSRANAVIAPIGGPSLSIRKFKRLSVPLRGGAPSWVASGLHDDAAALLEACVRERASILVSGATGSGKSTFLRSLAAAIPDDERLVVIEDTNELVLPHSHVVHLECVPARDGSGIGIADLVANALRMRPDRILVDEVRTRRGTWRVRDRASRSTRDRHPRARRPRSRGQSIGAGDRRDGGHRSRDPVASGRCHGPDARTPHAAARVSVAAAGALAAALAVSCAVFAPFARRHALPGVHVAHPDVQSLDEINWRRSLWEWEALRTGCIVAGAVLSLATPLPLLALL